jgi:hypothetical protein
MDVASGHVECRLVAVESQSSGSASISHQVQRLVISRDLAR